MHKPQFADVILTLIAIPLIMVVGIYLLACSIAPLVDLNTQTFKILFTVAGSLPTLLFYYKKSD